MKIIVILIFDEHNEDYQSVGNNLLPRNEKHPMYKSLFGLGCVTRSRIIRDGKIVSDKKIGIISLPMSSMRCEAQIQICEQ